MPNTTVTVVGNVVDDPELRFTPNGVAVANFRVASTPSHFNKASNEWEDGETLWLGVSCWRQAAHNVAESLTKGLRVVVVGQLRARSYEASDGSGKRTVFEIEADEIAPSIRFATAKVAKNAREQAAAEGGGKRALASAG